MVRLHDALSLVQVGTSTNRHLLLMRTSSLGSVALLVRLLHGKSVLVIKEGLMGVIKLLREVLHLGLETADEETTIVAVMPIMVASKPQLLALLLHGNNNRLLRSLELLLKVMRDILLLATLVDTHLNNLWVLHLDLQLLLD